MRDDLRITDSLDFLMLLHGDVGGAISVNSIHPPTLRFILQHAVYLIHGGAVGILGIFVQDISYSVFFGIGSKIAGEDILHNMLGIRVLDKLLVSVRGVAISRAAIDMFPVVLFISKYALNTVRGAIAFILIYGEHDIDGKPPVGRRGIIFLEDGFPVAVMGLQDGLCVL